MDLPNPILDASHETLNSDDGSSQHPTLASDEHKDICIIGAGPSGLGALKVLLDHPLFKVGVWEVVAFEARESVGGVWLPAKSSSTPDRANPPPTPLYDALTTNLPHPVMAYPSFSFPPSTPLFPPASTVLRYLETYAETFNLTQHIRFNHRVVDTRWDAAKRKWRVQVREGRSGEEKTQEYDLVVVANGHYSLPRYPTTPGLQAWLDAGKATHSVYYRNPTHPPCLEKVETVLVVGSGPSGLDISSELRTAGHKRIVHSFTGAVNEDLEGGGVKRRGRVRTFLDPTRGEVEFEDGTREIGIGHCVLATGYQDHFQFLHPPELRLDFPPGIPPLPAELYNSSYHVFPLAKHIFPLATTYPPSSIAFLGLPVRVVPFPLIEAQMRAVLEVLERPESLDTTQEAVDIVSRYEDLRAQITARQPSLPPSQLPFAIAKIWHILEEEHQFNYRDALHAFAGYKQEKWRVPAWVREMYPMKLVLRQKWRELEKNGEAEEWVKGVGEGGTEEWVQLMKKVLRRAEERRKGLDDVDDVERQRTRL
ncbi:hypothetical protein EIP91_002257 [Steccherinum ochraceum]|uniref:FAD/NAD(P)-binding domain-containing protein n=1 Tax=Steccherinum ochraceum TaxID=92696 RepID=A0A4R0RPK0_9APHY|nr:hypothetical protein EIP91_002257 [Steccherinum ochraceum]